ncbi:unnamed protein product, partial [Prorocentrum cordatum]
YDNPARALFFFAVPLLTSYASPLFLNFLGCLFDFQANDEDIEAVKKFANAQPSMEELSSQIKKMEELCGPRLSGSGGLGGAEPAEAARARAPAPDDAELEGGGGRWYWQQKKKSNDVYIRIPQDLPISKKDVSVIFKRSSLSIAIKGETIIDGKLRGTVDVDDCTWCILNGGTDVEVMLTKQTEDRWRTLLDPS